MKYYKTYLENMVLPQLSWKRGSKDSRGLGVKCLLSNDFILALSIFTTSAKLLWHRYFKVFHSNPCLSSSRVGAILGPLNPEDHSNSFGDDPKKITSTG